MKSTKIITVSLLAILAALFAFWAFSGARSGVELLAGALSAGLLGLCIPGLVTAFFQPPEALPAQEQLRGSRFAIRHPWVRIALWVLLLHAVLYAAGYLFDRYQNGYTGGVLDTLQRLWLRTDSPSYLGIAEHWYVTEGDPRFHIVFFPLYPVFIGLFNLIFHNSFASAMVVSNLFVVAGGILIYELAAVDHSRRDALFITMILMVFPGAIFLCAPMTESLFLALSLGCMFFVRKKQFLLAGCFGALAAFTRSVGLLLVVPLAVEFAMELIHKQGLTKKQIVFRALSILIVLLGTGGYILINYLVTGDPFKFMEYQRDHWSQRFSLFFSTSAYQLNYALNAYVDGDGAMLWGLSLPNLLCGFGSLILVALSAKKMRASYTAYFLAYFVMATGVTWLLSAPRYLAVCFPLAFAGGILFRRRGGRVAAAAVSFCLMLLYLRMYVLGFPVY